MTFVNEYIPEEDVKKYGLDELMASFHQWSWREGRPETFKHYWTIDRDRDIYLLLAKVVEDTGPSGRNEPTSQRLFILGWEGRQIKVLLELGDETSKKFAESPYRIVWKLSDLDTSGTSQPSRETILQNLCQALAVFGSDGIRWQVSNTKVECRF
jgi:hypothetical protein